MELKPTDEKLIVSLLTSGSIATAAEENGITRQTVYNRLSDPDFKSEYDRRRGEALNAATAALQSSLTAAVDVIRAVMNDALTAPQIKLNAAQILLSNALRFTEQTQLLSKIEELEKIIKVQQEEL